MLNPSYDGRLRFIQPRCRVLNDVGHSPILEDPPTPVSLSAMSRAAHDVINLGVMGEEGICRGTVHGLPSHTS